MLNAILRTVMLFIFLSIIISAEINNELVYNLNELKTAIEDAKPGDNIFLADGIWRDVQIDFYGYGTELMPITLKAETAGKVILEGQSYINLGGEYLVIDGLYFKDGYTPQNAVINFRINKNRIANNCKVINCVIENFNQMQRDIPDHWIEFWGRYNSLQNCYLSGKANQGPTIRVDIKGNENIKNYHKIINNHFGPRPRKGGPRGETIQIGDSQTSMSPSYTLVANNFFEKCNGEVEVISSKTNFNEFRNNVFYKCEGSLVTRHGNYCIIDGNYFIGDENSNNIGGIRIINTGHWVTNNYFYNLKGENFRSPLAVMNGIPKSPLNRYNQVTDVVIAYNSWINCKSPLQFGVGSNISQADVLPKSEIRSAIPIRTIVANNFIYNSINDNNIVVAYDKLDGIKFRNNYVNDGNEEKYRISGFKNSSVKVNNVVENVFIPGTGFDNVELYNGFDFENINKDILGNSRIIHNLPGAFCNNSEKISEIFDTKNYGPKWFQKSGVEDKSNRINIGPQSKDLNSILNDVSNGDTLLLADGIYNIKNSISINKSIAILPASENGIVTLKFSGKKGTPLFEMNPYGNLSIERVILQGDNSQYAFASLKENMSNHYNLNVNDCEILDFHYVLKAYKQSFADEIVFNSTKIRNCINGIELSEETNDKGDYNVEFLTITNCEFENISRNVIDYYRGGYDESTIGGNLKVVNSNFSNCGKDEENGILLNTRGIINVELSNNVFVDNEVKLVALLWGAKNNNHSENEIINSGKILVQENIKLKLMY